MIRINFYTKTLYRVICEVRDEGHFPCVSGNPEFL